MQINPSTPVARTASRTRLATRITAVWLLLTLGPAAGGDAPDPHESIRAAMDHWRGLTTYPEMTMTIHRSDRERRFSMRAWTEGDRHSLVRVTAPARDAGNGTLVMDKETWTYSPKINRVLKLPSAMMNRSWLGCDFSNKDISKSTDIIDDCEHRLIATGNSPFARLAWYF